MDDTLPLVPLQSVLFPDGLLSLKVFEARYLDLVSECLRTQQPFGVVCLRQGSDQVFLTHPRSLGRPDRLRQASARPP